jgi:glycosyltransferase involved in cell wall biosynthesis
MRISILIAAYKAAPFISKALASVSRQTHADWEVVEDGSCDGTEGIVREFASAAPQPVLYENFRWNCGVSAARNRLMELATGDACAFLDADDTWTPDHLANAARLLAKNADLAVSDVNTVDLPTGRSLGTIVVPDELASSPVAVLFERSAIVTSSAVAISRRFAADVGRFDPRLDVGEDRDFWLRCAVAGARFAATGRVTCLYSKHGASAMSRTLRVAEQNVRFYEKHMDLAGIPIERKRKALAAALQTHARLARAADAKASLSLLKSSWRLHPRPGVVLHMLRSLVSLTLRPPRAAATHRRPS